MIWASRSYDQWSDGTCVVLVLSAHFPNSISRILQKHSNLLPWAVRSQWTRITIESTVREHLILSVRENIRCYRSLDATVIRAWRSFDLRSNGIWGVFVLVSSGWTLWGIFCKKNWTTKELLDHISIGFEELVSPKHLRCGSTWYSYIQENMRSSFILDATVIRASRSSDMGSKGIWVVFVQIVRNSQTH